jgi:hypothetical protein
MKTTYSWKTYTSADLARRVWYDRRLRLWTMQELDENGSQTNSECEYTTDKKTALDYVGFNS